MYWECGECCAITLFRFKCLRAAMCFCDGVFVVITRQNDPIRMFTFYFIYVLKVESYSGYCFDHPPLYVLSSLESVEFFTGWFVFEDKEGWHTWAQGDFLSWVHVGTPFCLMIL